ncbi:MAG: hypothetical protein JXR36_08170 [Bacteroidales bacterium]|nr:hypothetical protein [Bacteroidales bacterium]
MKKNYAYLYAFIISLSGTAAFAESYLQIETGTYKPSRMDVQIPAPSNSLFDIGDLTGNKNEYFYRIEGKYQFGKHAITAIYAPLVYKNSAILPSDITFQNRTFAAGNLTDFSYQFNSYRIGYMYEFYNKGNWTLSTGITGKIRDAKIEVSQGSGITESKSNIGFVPLLDFEAVYKVTEKFKLRFDVDGLAGGPGYAVDAALQGFYDISDAFSILGGYRILDGGADTETYTFATFHYYTLGLRYRF